MSSNINLVGAQDLSSFINSIGKEVEAETMMASRTAAKNAGQKCVKALKATSAMRGKKYKRGWKVKSQDDGVVVFNSSQPAMTWLLENGHDVIRGGKKVGDVKARPHIEPTAQEGSFWFEEEVKKELSRRLGL